MAVAATVCAPLSGILVGRFGPRRPLLIAGSFTTLGGLCLVSLDNNTAIPMLLAAYLFLGIGFGFSNAPITNTAVNGLPRSQAGLAGGITSSARQFGAALGVALAGGILGGSAPVDVAQASSWDGSWLRMWDRSPVNCTRISEFRGTPRLITSRVRASFTLRG